MAKENTARPYADLKTPFTVDKTGAFAEYVVQEPDRMPDLAMGATVIIKDNDHLGDKWIAGQVIGLRAISPFSPERENLLYIEPEMLDPTELLDGTTGPHTHQPMIIRVSLDREMRTKPAAERQFLSFPVQRPPSAVSRLFFPNILPSGDSSPSLQEILDIRPEGLSLGAVGFGNTPYEKDEKFLIYKWDIDNLDNKHIFVVGESGSGKTVLLKNLAYEIRRHDKRNRVILTDVQGDIVQLLLPDIAKTLEPSGWQSKVDTESAEKVTNTLEDLQLIVPARPGDKSSANVTALKKLARSRGVLVREVGLRMQDLAYPSDVEYLFRVASTQVAMLLDDEAEFLRNNPTKPTAPTLLNLKKMISRFLKENSGSQITSHSQTSYYRSTYEAADRALRSLSQYFDYHQASLDEPSNPMDYFDFDGTTILYLDELDTDERIMWEMQLVKWLYDNKREDWHNLFVFFDEAHQIIPAKPVGIGAVETFERLRVNFEKLAREGRKFGINLVLSTQSPKDLHPIVPEQCPTRIVMKINPRNASYAFLDDNLAGIANRFGQGQFWIQSPFNGTADWVRVHSWAPQIPHEPMTGFWKKVLDAGRGE